MPMTETGTRQARARQTRTRPVSKVLLLVISLIVIALVALIVTGIHLSNPYLHKKVVEMLSEKFHAEVELKDFHVYLFPGARIEGSGLVLRHEGRTDIPPLISIREFTAEAGILGLPWKPWKVDQITLKGLVIQIPPKEERGTELAEGAQYSRAQSEPSCRTMPSFACCPSRRTKIPTCSPFITW